MEGLLAGWSSWKPSPGEKDTASSVRSIDLLLLGMVVLDEIRGRFVGVMEVFSSTRNTRISSRHYYGLMCAQDRSSLSIMREAPNTYLGRQ